MKDDILYYSVGALLYCPANRESLADSIIHEKIGTKYSLALCLEDTISDHYVEEAEQTLIASIQKIYNHYQVHHFYLPKIFIRVRNPKQIFSLTQRLRNAMEIITGYIIPKFSYDNAEQYINEIIRTNEYANKPIYMMPIYENSSIIHLKNRTDILYSLKDSLSKIEDRVLNIRVGGNDLCHIFGFRRHATESIHQIKPISNIFSDIITIYGLDYVVSGPVWEYYSGAHWDTGLRNEIKEDKLCGFIGKTAIHPNQIPIINQAYQVSQSDFNDAVQILNWEKTQNTMVAGSAQKNRMNEYKTHFNWAQKTIYLAENYGITNEE